MEDLTDYQTFTLAMTNFQFSLPGEQIVGISRTSDSIVSPTSDPFSEVLSFTADSITLEIDGLIVGQYFDFVNGGVATYSISTEVAGDAPVVPLPAALPLLALGLAGLGATRLRRRG